MSDKPADSRCMRTFNTTKVRKVGSCIYFANCPTTIKPITVYQLSYSISISINTWHYKLENRQDILVIDIHLSVLYCFEPLMRIGTAELVIKD